MARYFVRWRTAVRNGNRIVVTGWSICDNRRSQMLEVAEFGPGMDDLRHAEAICRLMNTQEDIDDSCSREG